MNNNEFIAEFAKEANITKKDAANMVSVFKNVLFNTIAKGEDINLTDMGKFSVNQRKEREGRNPRTGETIIIPSYKAVKFRPSASLKDAVNR